MSMTISDARRDSVTDDTRCPVPRPQKLEVDETSQKWMRRARSGWITMV